MRGRKLNDKQVQSLLSDYAEHGNKSLLSRTYKVSLTVVRAVIDNPEDYCLKPLALNNHNKAMIKRLRENGHSFASIGARLGVSDSHIHNIARDF